MITLDTIREHIDALEDKFGMDANVAYANISMTMLSVARHYGGCKVGSHYYIYNPTDDSLIREDVLKWLMKEIKKKAKAEAKPKQEPKSLDLSE